MLAELTGRLKVVPHGGAPVEVELLSEAPGEIGAEGEGVRVLSQDRLGEVSVVIELSNQLARSLSNHPVTIEVWIDDVRLGSGTFAPCVSSGSFMIGPVGLPQTAFADYFGSVSLRIDLYNVNGMRFSFHSGWLEVELSANANGERLRRMVEFLYRNARLILTDDRPKMESGAMQESGPVRYEPGRRVNSVAYLELIDRIIVAYTKLHRFFERSARFHLRQSRQLTSFTKLDAVTHGTLQYIATHPESLMPTYGDSGIIYEGKNYIPVRVLSETHKKSYDLYENRCLIGFLKTVLETARALAGELGALTHRADSPDGKPSSVHDLGKSVLGELFSEKLGHLDRIKELLASYSRLFELDDVPMLIAQPRPSSIFASSVQYRQIFDLMNEWFTTPKPQLREERFVLRAAKSSRLYELYVLGLLVKALDLEDCKRERVVWPLSRQDDELTCICNKISWSRGGKAFVLYYEPVVASGLWEGENEVGLIRTMFLKFSPDGVLEENIKRGYWRPDYVLRETNQSGRSRFWIGDAKYSAWPTIFRDYAKEVLFKYLIATSPKSNEDAIGGLSIFSGKRIERMASVPGSLRNADEDESRSMELKVVTFACDDADDDVASMKTYLKGCLERQYGNFEVGQNTNGEPCDFVS